MHPQGKPLTCSQNFAQKGASAMPQEVFDTASTSSMIQHAVAVDLTLLLLMWSLFVHAAQTKGADRAHDEERNAQTQHWYWTFGVGGRQQFASCKALEPSLSR